MLTNTHSVGVVRDAVIAWRIRAGGPDVSGYWWSLPVVAETWDGDLNDINGFHVRPEHAWRALDEASGGPVAEGNVGGGTGMTCHEFKCGIGTASRRVVAGDQKYTLGALVQANYGTRDTLRIAGVPVGQDLPVTDTGGPHGDSGSIIVVLATDAPLLATQLRRVAKRAALTLGNDYLDPLFAAAVQATEEAIVNAMVAARDMHGQDGHFTPAMPHDRLVELLKRYGRYAPPP